MRSASNKPLSVLITSGPTSVPIDAMRVITNRSTGEMGRLIANNFLKTGSRVTLLEGAVTTTIPVAPTHLKKFFTFAELQTLLNAELARHYDIVIHAAAVSDFEIEKPFKEKLGSNDNLTLRLVPTKKLVLDIKKKQAGVFLVGFKLESSIDKKSIIPKVSSLFDQSRCDLVVINRSDAKGYQAYIMQNDHSTTGTVASKKRLVNMLVRKCLANI